MQTLTEKLQKMKQDGMNEIITNSNGIAVKSPEGFMICTKTVTFSNFAVNTADGNVFRSDELELGDFAEEFIESPNISLQNFSSTAGTRAWLGVCRYLTKANAGTVYVYRGESNSSVSVIVSVTAVRSLEKLKTKKGVNANE